MLDQWFGWRLVERIKKPLSLGGTDGLLFRIDLFPKRCDRDCNPSELIGSKALRSPRALGLSSGGVTVALDRLEKSGYTRRERHPTDRRSVLITPIPKRMRNLESLYEEVESETRHLLTKLPQGDVEAVIRFFEALQAAYEGG